MKGKPKPKRKTAKTWPITNQNTPIKQHRRGAGTSGAELRDLIRQNTNNTLRQHRRYASLSNKESRDLIGKINKGNSCASVSQKRKQSHAVKCGRHYQRLKFLKKCYKTRKTEVSHTYKTSVKPHLLRHIKIKLSGHGILPNRVPNKTKESRLLNLDKVRQQLKSRQKTQGSKPCSTFRHQNEHK